VVFFWNCDSTELKRCSKIFFPVPERHRWAVVGWITFSIIWTKYISSYLHKAEKLLRAPCFSQGPEIRDFPRRQSASTYHLRYCSAHLGTYKNWKCQFTRNFISFSVTNLLIGVVCGDKVTWKQCNQLERWSRRERMEHTRWKIGRSESTSANSYSHETHFSFELGATLDKTVSPETDSNRQYASPPCE